MARSLLSSSSSTEKIRAEVDTFITKIAKRLRKNYVEKRNITGLMNDVATLECIFFAVRLLQCELNRREVDSNIANLFIREGLGRFFFVDNQPKNQLYVDSIVNHLDEKSISSFDECIIIFISRLFFSNQKGSALHYNMHKDTFFSPGKVMESIVPLLEKITGNKVAIQDENEVIALFLASVLEEIGEINEDGIIYSDTQQCVDNIIDYYFK